ncbi:MAG: polyketide cyclase, partial [Clostridia bacterium]
SVLEVEPDRCIRFHAKTDDPDHPPTVEFLFVPYQDDKTYVQITETGFIGAGDARVARALDSTAGYSFLLSALKAALEHDIHLQVTADAHPPDLHLPTA